MSEPIRDACSNGDSDSDSEHPQPSHSSSILASYPWVDFGDAEEDEGRPESTRKHSWFSWRALQRVPRALFVRGFQLFQRHGTAAAASPSLLVKGDPSLPQQSVQAADSGGPPPPPTSSSSERRRELNMALEQAGVSSAPLAPKALRVQILTWNVAQQSPPEDFKSLRPWVLGSELAASVARDPAGSVPLDAFPDIVVVGLQEVEFGGVALVVETTDSSVAWMEAVTDCLNDAVQWRTRYKKLRTIQLVGIVLIVIIKVHHEPFVNHICTSLSRTGAVGGVMGNKGSIGLRMTMYGKRFLFVCAHFHPHLKNEATRIKNYHNALAELKFRLPVDADDAFDVVQLYDEAFQRLAAASSKKSPPQNRGDDEDDHDRDGYSRRSIAVYRQRERTEGQSTWSRLFSRRAGKDDAVVKEFRVLESHDYIFFFGDLNYRLHGAASESIRNSVAAAIAECGEPGAFHDLLNGHDELSLLMRRRALIFQGFGELPIHFPPTYKYDLGTDNFDSGKKKRDPAWTDRILFRTLATNDDVAAASDQNQLECSTLGQTPTRSFSRHRAAPPKTVSPEAGEIDAALPEFPRLASETFSTSDDDVVDNPLPRVSSTVTAARAGGRPRSASSSSFNSSGGGSSGWSCLGVQKAAFADIIPNSLTPLAYHSITSLRISDHKPVYASFSVDGIGAAVHDIQNLMLQSRDYWDTEHCDVDAHL